MIRPTEFRLADADRELYDGDEWTGISSAIIIDQRASVLRDMEQQTGLKLTDLMTAEGDISDVATLTAVVWISRRAAGFGPVKFSDFDPLIWQATLRPIATTEADDVDPPATSSETSSEATVSTAGSPSSSPGRGKRGSSRSAKSGS